MGIAHIGGAASPQVIYGQNKTGAAVQPGDVVEVKLVDGDGDGYEFTTPDIDLTKPESLFARCGVVKVCDGPIEIDFADGANIPVVVEGPVTEVSVDANSPNIAKGDLLIKQDNSSDLVKMQNTIFDVSALTSGSLTDSSGGTASQTIAAISGSGADSGINNNFASLSDEINKAVADLTALRDNVLALVDSLKVVAVARAAATADNATISAQIIKV